MGEAETRNGDLDDPYWDSRIHEVLAKWPDAEGITDLSFEHDADGPVLGVGVRPYAKGLIRGAEDAFAPYRVRTFPGSDTDPA